MLRPVRATAPLLLLVGLAGCATGDADPLRLDDGRPCEPGERRCVARATQTCGPDGLWGVPQGCRSGEGCAEGVCALACQGCTVGEQRCAPEGLQRCVAAEGGCGAWSPPEACGEGGRCIEGVCVTDCPAACEPGSRRCLGADAYNICVGGACPEWAPAEQCPPGEVCSGGLCADPGACTDQCQDGARGCLDAETEVRCVQVDPAACLDWGEPTTCPERTRCRAGSGCVEACVDEGCVAGSWRCTDGGRQRCVVVEPGCHLWGAIEACVGGTTCEDGACVEAACEDTCLEGQRRCGEGGVETCVRDADCTLWSDAVACPGDTQCAGAGECGVCAPDATESRPCGNCGTQTRTCGADGQWGEWSACEGGGACQPGARDACGNCGTRTCTAECTWGACQGAGPCAPGQTGDCGQCGMRTCNGQCQWGGCNNGDGTTWRRCNQCGWQFCCPNGDWCNCAAHFPDACGGAQCVGAGTCQ